MVDVLCAVFSNCNIFQKYLFSELVTFLFAYVEVVSCDSHVALGPSLMVEGREKEKKREGERGKERERYENGLKVDMQLNIF